MIENPQKKDNLKRAISRYLVKPGCTHPLADNYNKTATKDDGSCEDRALGNVGFENYSYSSWIKIDSATLFLIISVLFII